MKTLLDMALGHRTISGKQKQYILSFEWEWENYSLEEYNSPRLYFDNIRKVESLVGKEFHHEDVIEDHWMNATNDCDV